MRPKIWSMFPVASILRTGQPMRSKYSSTGHELAQPVADDGLGIVAALDEGAAATIADAGDTRRLGDEVVAGLAALAGAAVGDAGDELFVGGVQDEDVVQLLALLGEHLAQRLSLGDGARKAVEEETAHGLGLREPLGDEVQHQGVGDQLPLVDELLGAGAEGCVVLDGRAQHVAGGDVRNLEDRRQPLGLGPLPRTRGSKQQEVLTQRPDSSFARRRCR